MIIIVVYAVTEVSIKTAVLTSTLRLATQNRGLFRWGLCVSLVWISKPVILCIKEEALSLLVFTIVFVLFFVAVIFLTHHCIVCHYFCLSYVTVS